jgi:hypothetical protein
VLVLKRGIRHLTAEDPFTVFISYARPDSRRAREAYGLLREASLGPWLDSENIPAGSEWAPYIERAIRDSSIVLVLLSRNSVRRDGFLQREILSALEHWREKAPGKTYLIPARLDDCPKHERLAHLHWIDLFGNAGWTQLIGQLQRLRQQSLGASRAEV